MIGVLDRVPSGQRKFVWAEGLRPARIWTAIRHVGVRHPSESGWPERCSWDPSLSWHIGFARRPHSVTPTECGRRESEVTGINLGSREHCRRRDIAPTDGCEPFLSQMSA